MIYNLLYVVRQAQLELDDNTTHRRGKLLQLAIKGFRELRLSALPSIKVAHLIPNEINCVDFPKDYEFYTKIGVNINGKLWTLTRNDDIILNRRQDDCGNDIAEVENGNCLCNYGYDFAPHWWSGTWWGPPTPLYGYGGGINCQGYYTIDYEMQRIQFSGRIPQTEIILEYVSNGVEPDGSSVIPTHAVNCLTAYIHWQNIAYNQRVSLSSKQEAKQMYFDEYQKMMEVQNPFRLDEYLDQRNEFTKQSPMR